MKVESALTKRLVISEVPHLDPITVYMEDYEPGKGKITVECYGQSWSAYWGGMSGRTVGEFFCDCDVGYIANRFSSIKPNLFDPSGLKDMAKRQLFASRRKRDVSEREARETYDAINDANDEGPPHECHELFKLVYQAEWYESDIPTKPNPEYQYLCRIIQAVKDGIRTTLQIRKHAFRRSRKG
jgi:hypothetical protein